MMEMAYGRYARVETAREDMTGNEAITNVMDERKRTWRVAVGRAFAVPGSHRHPEPRYFTRLGDRPATFEPIDWNGAVD